MKINNNEVEKYFDNMKRCTTCILPETFPGIKYDQSGVCNYCDNSIQIEVEGEQKLGERLSEYRNIGDKYDCIVPISGGRDSCFVLYEIVKKYEMRVLALTVDTGSITPEGIHNINRATKILNVDHVWIRNEDKIKRAKRNIKTKFHSWLKRPSINTIVPVLNSGDKTINLQMYNYAKKHNIPLVLGGTIIGNSSFEQEHFKTGFLGVFPDDRGIYSSKDKIKLVWLFLWEYLKNPGNFKIPILTEYIQGGLVYFFDSILKPKGVDSLGFYDYVYWDESEILKTIYSELDWQGAADTSTTWRIDDWAYPLVNYLYYQLVGFTEHDEMYSKMIREGQITREQALQRCALDHKPRIPSLTGILTELCVAKDELDEVLSKYRKSLLPNILKDNYLDLIIN